MRSYQRQEKPQIPTVHLGRAVSAMEARGEKTFLGDLNRDIKETNKLLAYLRKGFRTLRSWAAEKIKEAKERHEQIGGHRKGDETWEDGQLPTR